MLQVLYFFLLFLASATALCQRKECNCSNDRTGGRESVCHFNKRQNLEMRGTDFPEDLSSVELTGGRELRFHTEVFSKLTYLHFVRIADVPKVLVQEHTFANMSSSRKVRFEFEGGSSLVLEARSWKNVAGEISVSISRFSQVIIQAQAFSGLYDLTVSQVAKFELLEDAFFIERPPRYSKEFKVESIILDQVKLENLERKTFYSSAHQVKIRNSHIKTVRTDAFNAISLAQVTIENTTIDKVEHGAFSGRTILHTLTLDRVILHELESGAVLSGTTHLNIHHSRFGTLQPGTFNVTVAIASISDNIFNRLLSRAMILKQWDRLSINNNTFKKLDPYAFSSEGLISKAAPIINFSKNNLYDNPTNAFDFHVNNELNYSIGNNFFNFKCRCDMAIPLKAMIKPYSVSEVLFRNGLCDVDHSLSKCFDLPEGFYNMLNFTERICSVNEVILCEEIQRDAAVPPQLPGISSAVDTMFENNVGRERKILGSIFIIALCAMVIMMIISAVMWIGRNGYCTKARVFLLPSTNSYIGCITRFFSGSGMTPTGSAHSISRLSIHEYAELQRKIGEAKEEEEIPLEDKATQTLPEELTQELLQSLQEKLNDPENYSEARNMIEHLYDLIKVEESCNKNYKDSASINLDDLDKENENVYDVIVPKKKTISREKKETVSTGTRAPSPDKLLPYTVYGETRKLQPAVCDYMEPKDRQVHTYTELPNRTPGPTSVVCDYGEPTDTRVHFYTELPAKIKMANRPLPSKPIDGGQSMS